VDRTGRLPRAALATVVIAVAALVAVGLVAQRPAVAPTAVRSALPGGTAAARGTELGGTPAARRPAADGPDAGRSGPLAASSRTVPRRRVTAPTVDAPEGFAVLRGSGAAGEGPTVHFTVEVERRTGIDPAEALAVAEDALFDRRSWAREVHLVRVDEPELADIRLLFALPSTVDRLCGEAGLRTYGIYSCWTGRFAAINSWRYAFGATGFADQELYRRYVVNHEVGHGLGHRHVGCPDEGERAPLMLQQTASLAGCTANGWPYPDG
jgi:hypothetical protein